MRSGVGLCVLGLLCLHSSVFGQEVAEVPPGVLIFCDDPSVEKAVHSAVTKFNEKLTSGNKLALFQTVTASKSENGADSVYSLQFTSRRSDCTAGSSKPWTDCDYLAVDRKPISCNATVYMTETETDTRQVDCVLDDYVVPERAQCLGCPQEIPDNSEDLRGPLTASIHKYNSMSDSTHLFAFNNVHHATRQVVAGLRYKLKFDMRRTNCAKAEHKDLNQLCVPDETNVEFANCNSTVDVAPWRHEPPQTQIECQPGELPMVFTRRRPPGWSPLRNLFYEVPSNVSTKPDPQPTPTKAAKEAGKEESSEEDTTAAKPSVSPDASPDSVSDAPFHCPSKPWKPFNPVSVAGTGAPEQVTGDAIAQAAEPTPAGSFANTDLLG